MDELDQLDKIIEGFQKQIDKIDGLNAQDELTIESLDIQKAVCKLMIKRIKKLKSLLKKIGPEIVKERFGEDRIQKDLKIFAKSLSELTWGVDVWEGIINKNSKTQH